LSRACFQFADCLHIFVHCHLAAGKATGQNWQGSRRRREVSDQERNVYSLAEDPLYLAQGKREEKVEKDLDNSGM